MQEDREDLNSAVIIWDLDENGDVFAYVVDVDYFVKAEGELPITKFPGGGNFDHPEDGTDPKQTGKREVKEEVGLIIPIEYMVLIHKYRAKGSQTHYRYFYAIPLSVCMGEIRKGGTVGGRSMVSEAYPVKVMDLHYLINDTHAEALQHFERYVERLFEAVYN